MAFFGLSKKNKVKPSDIFAELMTAVISGPIEYIHTLFQEKLVMAHSFHENGNEEKALEYFSAIKSAAIQLITISKAKENKGGIATDEELFETLNCATESIIFIN